MKTVCQKVRARQRYERRRAADSTVPVFERVLLCFWRGERWGEGRYLSPAWVLLAHLKGNKVYWSYQTPLFCCPIVRGCGGRCWSFVKSDARVKLKTCRASKPVLCSWKYGGNGVLAVPTPRIHHPKTASYYAKIKILYTMYFIKNNNYHTLNKFQYLLLFYFHTRIYLLLSIRTPANDR